jgi:hypothetical protein
MLKFDRIRICGSMPVECPTNSVPGVTAKQTCNLVRSEFQIFRAAVVEIVAAKALWNHSEPQFSTAWPQRIQSKPVNRTRFQHTSTRRKIWFGSRVSAFLKACKSAIYKAQLVEVYGFWRFSQPQNHLHCPSDNLKLVDPEKPIKPV